MRIAGIMFILCLLACADEEPIARLPRSPQAAQAAAAAVSGKTGVVHEIQMIGSIESGFRFEPADVRIKVGDTVQWINSSGLPHNVAFYADRIPQGAMEVIESVMPGEGKLGPMNGRIVSELGDTFEMDFLHAPVGTYHYFSVVQEAIGMEGTLTVEQ